MFKNWVEFLSRLIYRFMVLDVLALLLSYSYLAISRGFPGQFTVFNHHKRLKIPILTLTIESIARLAK